MRLVPGGLAALALLSCSAPPAVAPEPGAPTVPIAPPPSAPHAPVAPRPATPPAASPAAPDLNALRASLRAAGSHRFDEAAQQRGCPRDQTLGQYLDLLIRNTTHDPDEPDRRNQLTGGCRDFPPPDQLVPLDPPADDAHWYCVVDAYTADYLGHSPWHYELRLRVRRKDGALDLAHLSCPGSP